MFPLILAAVLFLSLLFLCGRYYLIWSWMSSPGSCAF
jgi:hypothetical protein